jgi:hypothetical protein
MSSPWTLVGNLVKLLDENNTVRVGPPVAGSTTPRLEVSGSLVTTGAATLPLHDHGGNVFDVSAYGTKGDGFSDDLPRINDAVAALRTGGGGTLYFPPGVYRVTNEILLDGWIPRSSKQVPFLVRGAGPGATTIRIETPSAHGFRTVYGGGLTSRELFMEIRDLKIEAVGMAPPTGSAIRQECDPKFQNTLLVRNCWFLNVYNGINPTSSGSTIIKDCQFVNPLHAAILLEQRLPDNTDVGTTLISECLFFDKSTTVGGTSQFGVLATTGGAGVRLHHNVFVNFQHPMMFDHTESPPSIRTALAIEDNLFDGGSSGPKIHIKGHSELRSVNICNNQIHASSNGILVEMTQVGPNDGLLWQGVISGNIFLGTGSGARGIVLSTSGNALVRDVLIASNHFLNLDVGIEVANERCQFIAIHGNSFQEPDPTFVPPIHGVVTPLINHGANSRGAFFPDRIGVGHVNDVAVSLAKEIYAFSSQPARPRIYLQGVPGVSSPGIEFAFDGSNVRRAGIVGTATGAAGVQLELFTKPDGAGITQRAVLDSDGNLIWTSPSFQEIIEVTLEPPAPAANRARLFLRDNGGGKTQLCVKFSTGAVQVISTQP